MDPEDAVTAARRVPGRPGAPAEKRRLRAQGERTVRRLLDAGIEVFSRNGYHATRVDDIVALAETSHGTFYLYFSNKEDLFRRLALDVAAELAALVDDLGELEPTPAARAHLRDWLRNFLDLYRHYGPLLRAWTAAEIESTETGRLGADVLGRFTAAIAERVARIPDRCRRPEGDLADGGLDRVVGGSVSTLPTDPQVTALALVAMIERFGFFVLIGHVVAGRDDVVDTLTEAVWRMLFGPQPIGVPQT